MSTTTVTPSPSVSGAPSAIEGVPAHVDVYSPDFKILVTIPQEAIIHLPPQKLAVTRLVLCDKFTSAVDAAGEEADPRDPTWRRGICPMGRKCKFVHVARPIREFPSCAIHVHYIWQSEADVSYRRIEVPEEDASSALLEQCMYCNAEVKRYDAQRISTQNRISADGGNVEQHDKDEDERVAFAMMVDLIASVAPAMRIPVSRLLYTKGAAEHLRRLKEGTEPYFRLAPCYQYACHDECRLGEDCTHAHVINIDPSQPTPFVRRTLRHVKAAAEAIAQLNDGRFTTEFRDSGDVYVSLINDRSNPGGRGTTCTTGEGDVDETCSVDSNEVHCTSSVGGSSSIAPAAIPSPSRAKVGPPPAYPTTQGTLGVGPSMDAVSQVPTSANQKPSVSAVSGPDQPPPTRHGATAQW